MNKNGAWEPHGSSKPLMIQIARRQIRILPPFRKTVTDSPLG